MSPGTRARLVAFWAVLCLTALLASAAAWEPHFDRATILPMLTGGTPGNFWQTLFRDAFLPRLAAGFLAGGGLALAGALLQLALRNPLASPTTLGVSAGSQLALALAALTPALSGIPAPAIALAGAIAAFSLVLAAARRTGFDPAGTALAGVAVSLLATAAASLIALLREERLSFLFLWGSGHLAQADWDVVRRLGIQLAFAVLLVIATARPLRLLAVGDDVARALGFPSGLARLCAVALAVVISAVTVSQLGVIGFVGLAVPAMLRLAGVSFVAGHPLATVLTGGLMVVAADALARFLSLGAAELVPAGAVTALLGGPVLLSLVRRMPRRAQRQEVSPGNLPLLPGHALIPASLVALALAMGVALLSGTDAGAFGLPDGPVLGRLLEARWPRVFAAAACGAALGLAGLLIQKLTHNRLASPELLGINGGAALAIMGATLALGDLSRGAMVLAGTCGALACLTLLLAIAPRRADMGPHLILAGIALGVFMDSVLRIALANAGPRLGSLLTWLSGSTALATGPEAIVALAAACVGTAALMGMARALDLLTLGADVARGRGLVARRTELLATGAASLAAAMAVAIIGPLGFVGLLAPQAAILLGARRTAVQMPASAMLGASLMVAADWVGRRIAYPFEIPAGLVGSFAGALILLALIARTRP